MVANGKATNRIRIQPAETKMKPINIGDLVEFSVTFESGAIDPFYKENKICFLVVADAEINHWTCKKGEYAWGLPQFPLNEKGSELLKMAKDSGYPASRTGYWLLKKEECRIIKR